MEQTHMRVRTFWFGERGKVVRRRRPDDSEVVLVVSYSSLENSMLINFMISAMCTVIG